MHGVHGGLNREREHIKKGKVQVQVQVQVKDTTHKRNHNVTLKRLYRRPDEQRTPNCSPDVSAHPQMGHQLGGS